MPTFRSLGAPSSGVGAGGPAIAAAGLTDAMPASLPRRERSDPREPVDRSSPPIPAISSATAATRPTPQWPGGARIAVQFVLNYEEGGENNILHGDAASEAFLSEIVGAQPWPGSAT